MPKVTITVSREIADYWYDQCEAEIMFWESAKKFPAPADDNPKEMIDKWRATQASLRQQLDR